MFKYTYKYNRLQMNTTNNQLITPKETLHKMSRVQDIFRELDQESREVLLKFLNKKYCNHPSEFNKYIDKHHNNGICKLCGKKWKLYLSKNQTTTLQYYNDISELDMDNGE